MAALQAYRKYGVSPKIVSFLLQKSRTISHFQDCLDKYFLLYWEGKYLLEKSTQGTITKDDTTYLVIYSPSCSRGHVLANKNRQFAVSFRKAKPEFNLQAYALVSIPEERNW